MPLDSKTDSGYNDNITKEERKDGKEDTQDTGLLVHGRETAAVSGSGNNQRQQGYDSSTFGETLEDDGKGWRNTAGKSGHKGKAVSWLSRNRFVSQASLSRFNETLLRNRTGLSKTDVNGRAVPSNVLERFKDTVFTDENGTVSTVYNVGQIKNDTLPSGKLFPPLRAQWPIAYHLLIVYPIPMKKSTLPTKKFGNSFRRVFCYALYRARYG